MAFPQEAFGIPDAAFVMTPVAPTADPLKHAGEWILRGVGEDLGREGLRRTPERFAKAMRELCSGYQYSPAEAVGEGVFRAEGGLISVRNVEFFSLCEHHMLPFWGRAHVAYIPTDRIVGLSKIPRLMEVFARRLQVQERLTREVAQALAEVTGAKAVAVRVSASHMCMMMRGVRKSGSETMTEYALGMEGLTTEEQGRLWKAVE